MERKNSVNSNNTTATANRSFVPTNNLKQQQQQVC
jgi:hypothetical protein